MKINLCFVLACTYYRCVDGNFLSIYVHPVVGQCVRNLKRSYFTEDLARLTDLALISKVSDSIVAAIASASVFSFSALCAACLMFSSSILLFDLVASTANPWGIR